MFVFIYLIFVLIVDFVYCLKFEKNIVDELKSILRIDTIVIIILVSIREYFDFVTSNEIVIIFVILILLLIFNLLIDMKKFEYKWIRKIWSYVIYLIVAPFLFIVLVEIFQVMFFKSLNFFSLLNDNDYHYIDYNLWIQYAIICFALLLFIVFTVIRADESRTLIIKNAVYWVVAIVGTVSYFLSVFFPEGMLEYFNTTNTRLNLDCYKSYFLFMIIPYLIALLWANAIIEYKLFKFSKKRLEHKTKLDTNNDTIIENLIIINKYILNDSLNFDEETQNRLNKINDFFINYEQNEYYFQNKNQ